MKMIKTTPLLDKWVQENNDHVNTWKEKEGEVNTLNQDQKQSILRRLSSEFHKLLSKIQGAPFLAGITNLELTVMYNACVFSISLSEFSEAEQIVTHSMAKVLQIPDYKEAGSHSLVFWRKVSEESLKHTDLSVCIGQLFYLQWAIWLATCRFNIIQELEKEISLFFNTLEDTGGKLPDTLLLVLEPKVLVELLRVCTLIAQGAEKIKDGQISEAFVDLQAATSLPAPTTLVASTHLLLGSSLVQMNRPQMALLCYRKALETDAHCVSALYQSILVYRKLENTQAEIQALQLLHSALMLSSTAECGIAGLQLIFPSLLLCSQSLCNLLSVPSALTVLHTLAIKCVLHGRVSEGVEHYLDLLASLHTDQQNLQVTMKALQLPRLTELYLEAGAAMLMAQRTADCILLCDEVINTTLDQLPERLVLEAVPSNLSVDRDDKGAMILWTGAAYLLQGHCHTYLKDWKQAVTLYTRCVNLLVKVCFKKKGLQPQIPSTDMVDKEGTELFILQRLKGLSLAGRGICFAQTDQLREALRDLQLSLHAFPECVGAGLWHGEVLWRLGRRQDAAGCWKKTWSFNPQSPKESVCVYLLEPPTDHLMDPTELRLRMQESGSA